MNKLVYCFWFILPINLLAQIGIGTLNPHESSILDIQSSNRGFLPPRMNYSDIQNIQGPADGLIVYCLDCCGSGTGTIAVRTAADWSFINKDDPSCTFIADQPMFTDFDLDGVPNTLDKDIDGDGIPNTLEAPTVLLTNESNGTFGTTTAGAPKDVDSEVSGYAYSPNGETEGTYAVISKNSEWHKFDLWDYTGHTDQSNEDAFLAVNGGPAIGTFYSQSIPMIPNVPYTFSFWSRGTSYTIQGRVAESSNPSKVLASANQSSGAGNTLGDWVQTSFTHTNTSSGVELFTFSIANLSTSSNGNDFAIDDVTAGPTNPNGVKINDYDQDGLTNDYDLDSDGDGIPDNVEYQTTVGYIAPGANTAVDGDGILSAYSTPLADPINTDGDALYDFLDPDSDNDGVLDKNENGLTLTGTDVDNDGLDDGADADISSSAGSVTGQVVDGSNNVTLPGANPGDGNYRFLDFDGDGELDANDLDYDNDGIPNSVEQSATLLTAENNGAFSGNAGTPSDVEGDIVGYSYATNGQSAGTYAVINKDIQWHTSNLWDYPGHTDGSNTDPFLAVNGGTSVGVFYNQTVSLVPNVQYTFSFWGRGDAFTIESRLIADNDISNTPVATARLSTPNTIGWTQKTFTYVNQSNDIELFRFEIGNLSTGAGNDFAIDDVSAFPTDPNITISMDHDLDGIPNEYDTDSDGDGIPDNVEAQTTSGYIVPTGSYTNGIDNAYGAGLTSLPNTDGDSYPDYIDADSDNDGVSDKDESGLTFTGVDSDKDGIDDGADGDVPGRGDANGLAHDGTNFTLTQNSGGTEMLYRTADYDGDGVNDDVDFDIDNDGILNVDEASGSLFMSESNGTFGETSVPRPMTAGISGYTYAPDGLTGGTYAIISKDCSWHTSNIWDYQGRSGTNTDAFLAVNGDNVVGAFYKEVITLEPGIEYTFTFYSRGNSYGVNGHLYLDIDRVNSVVNEAGPTSSSAWVATTFTYTNPGTIPQKYLFQIVNSSTGTSGNDFAIDDISVATTDPNIIIQSDFDGDGISNQFDLDSDNDGIPDNVEYQSTSGYTLPGANTAVDANGVLLAYSGGLKNPINTDGDSYLDYLDIDSDNDNVLDKYESGFTLTGLDIDNDGLDDGADEQVPGHSDVNGNAITGTTNTLAGAGPEKDYRFKDFDGDLVQDDDDLDIDNDGILNEDEGISNLLTNEFNGTFGTTSTPVPTSSAVLNYNFNTSGLAGGTYAIISQDCHLSWHSGGLWNHAGHTTGDSDDAFLAINGHSSVGRFYSQWIILPPGVEFEFSYWSRGSSYGLNSRLFHENDMVVSVLNQAGATNSSNWVKSSYTFTNTSSENQRYLFDIVNSSTGTSGNDFAIDDIVIKPTDPTYLFALDTDGDGLSNIYDLDSDGDGIPDNVEAQTTAGYQTPGTTVDAQGRLTATGYGVTGLQNIEDTDGDGTPDYLDSDSDNDNVLDKLETGFTLTGQDIDKDGLDDGADETVPGYGDYNGKAITGTTTNTLPAGGSSGEKAYRFQDTDNDGIANSSDLDIDNDGILNVDEVTNGFITQEFNGTFGTTSTVRDLVEMSIPDYTYASDNPTSGNYSVISQTGNYSTENRWNFAGRSGAADDAFLAVKGSTTADQVFYKHAIALTANSNYSFSYYHRGHAYTIEARIIQVSTGQIIATDSYSNGSTTGSWTIETFNFTSSNYSGLYRVEIINKSDNSHVNNNRFAIDDISITGTQATDYDNDGIDNVMDLDSDGDGIPDNVEAHTTAGFSDPGTTVDAQGRLTSYGATGITSLVDTDNNGFPDFIDVDSDGDEILDRLESGLTLTGEDLDKDGIDDGADDNTAEYGSANGIAINNIGANTLVPDPNGGTDKAYREAAFTNVTQLWPSDLTAATDFHTFTLGEVEWLGSAIEMSADGNVVVVGAQKTDYSNPGVQSESGSAFILRHNGTAWIPEIRLNSDDPKWTDYFGKYVSISADGNTVAVGAPQDDPSTSQHVNNGAVYIFKYNGSWSLDQKIIPGDVSNGDLFGTSVSINDAGDAFVAGSPGADAIYYYTYGSSTWTQTQKIVSSDVTSGDKFGTSTDISGDGNTIVVGSPDDDHDLNTVGGSQADRGSAYIFKKSGSTFTEQAQVYAPDALASDKLGFDVALNYSGDKVVIGAPFDNHNLNGIGGDETDRGSAHVFSFNGSFWNHDQQIYGETLTAGARLGYQITFSNNGQNVAFGLEFDNHGGTTDRGSVLLFKDNGDSFQPVKLFSASDGRTSDSYGSGVGMNNDGTKLIIGAKQNETSTSNGHVNGTGSIYIIE